MRLSRSFLAVVVGVLLLMGGCGGTGDGDAVVIDSSDDDLIMQASTWVNNVGLMQTDPEVWRARLELACSEGVWDQDVATELAGEFIEENLELSVRAPELGELSVEQAAQALWIMAVNVCRDAFPEGAIEVGPPGL